jgi:hypothetical protein
VAAAASINDPSIRIGLKGDRRIERALQILRRRDHTTSNFVRALHLALEPSLLHMKCIVQRRIGWKDRRSPTGLQCAPPLSPSAGELP